MTPEEKQRLEQIRHYNQLSYTVSDSNQVAAGLLRDARNDIDFLLSLVKEQEAGKRVADDLPYRIVEEMGLGLTFRSCTCGQLPCARLRPLRDALEAVATAVRSACVEKVKAMRKDWQIEADARRDPDNPTDYKGSYGLAVGAVDACDDIIKELESLSIEKSSL